MQGLRGGSAEVLSQRRDSPCQGGVRQGVLDVRGVRRVVVVRGKVS